VSRDGIQADLTRLPLQFKIKVKVRVRL